MRVNVGQHVLEHDLLEVGVEHLGVRVESPTGTLSVHDGKQVTH